MPLDKKQTEASGKPASEKDAKTSEPTKPQDNKGKPVVEDEDLVSRIKCYSYFGFFTTFYSK
jgi:hypothetical protein